MFRGINIVHAAAQHRDRAGGQGALVRRGVDAARQARDDDVAALAQFGGKPSREPLAGGRGDTRADDRHGRPVQQLHRPRAQISGGGGSSAANACGKAASQDAISSAPSAAPSASSLSTWASVASFKLERPPRAARPGRAASAAVAVPNRCNSWSKVTGRRSRCGPAGASRAARRA